MYNLFTPHYNVQSAVTKPAAFELIQRTYQREIEKITDYFNNRVFTVPGNHLLCRILDTLTIPLSYETEMFLETLYARAPFVANHFRLTSSRNYGMFHDGVFYGAGNNEILFYNEEYFNPFEALDNWKKLKPIKVLAHQISDLGLILPDGQLSSTASGFCALSINIPMLICMYRGFMLERSSMALMNKEMNQLKAEHFVKMYVLPSMLSSHIDIVIMNRLNNLARDNPMSKQTRRYAFAVIDYSQKLDLILVEVMQRLKTSKNNYYSYLQNIPSIYHESMLESLIMPSFPQTRQVWWALTVSRAEIMSLLLLLGGQEGMKRNGTHMADLKKTCRYLLRENMLKSLLPADLYTQVTMFTSEVLEQ